MLKFNASTQAHCRKGLMALLWGVSQAVYGPLSLAESGIVVVASKDSQVTQLSREDVAELFLGKRKYSNDFPVTPIDSKDEKLRDRFYLAVTEMSNIRIKAYWSRIVFSGQGRPPQEASITEAGLRLINEPGTLTYLPADQVTPDMKIVFSIP